MLITYHIRMSSNRVAWFDYSFGGKYLFIYTASVLNLFAILVPGNSSLQILPNRSILQYHFSTTTLRSKKPSISRLGKLLALKADI